MTGENEIVATFGPEGEMSFERVVIPTQETLSANHAVIVRGRFAVRFTRTRNLQNKNRDSVSILVSNRLQPRFTGLEEIPGDVSIEQGADYLLVEYRMPTHNQVMPYFDDGLHLVTMELLNIEGLKALNVLIYPNPDQQEIITPKGTSLDAVGRVLTNSSPRNN